MHNSYQLSIISVVPDESYKGMNLIISTVFIQGFIVSYTYILTYILTYIHTNLHTYLPTYIQKHTHS